MNTTQLRNIIRNAIKEQAYGSATLTTQGQAKSRAIVGIDEYPFTAMPNSGRLPGVWEQENEDQSGLWQRAKDLADSYSTNQLKNRLQQVFSSLP